MVSVLKFALWPWMAAVVPPSCPHWKKQEGRKDEEQKESALSVLFLRNFSRSPTWQFPLNLIGHNVVTPAEKKACKYSLLAEHDEQNLGLATDAEERILGRQ